MRAAFILGHYFILTAMQLGFNMLLKSFSFVNGLVWFFKINYS